MHEERISEKCDLSKGIYEREITDKKISSIMMVILLVMMSVSRAGVNRAYATDEKKTIVVYDWWER